MLYDSSFFSTTLKISHEIKSSFDKLNETVDSIDIEEKNVTKKIDTYIGDWRVPYNRKFVHLFDYRKGKIDKSYLISDYGEVISFKRKTPIVIKQFDKDGYKIFVAGEKPNLFTHVAVLFSFMYQYYFVSSKGYPKPQCSEAINSSQDFKKFIDGRLNLNDIDSDVHHKDEDKHNNKLSNLLLTYGDTHKAYHDIKKMKHDENEITDLLSVTAKIKNRDIQKPTLFNIEGGSVQQITTFEEEDGDKFGNEFLSQKFKGKAVIVWHEREMKIAVYDKWLEMINEDPTRALHPQCIKFIAQEANTELFYKIPKAEDWQDLPEEQFLTFDFIKRIPRRERGILATVQY